MTKSNNRFERHPWITLGLVIALGAVFLVPALDKLAEMTLIGRGELSADDRPGARRYIVLREHPPGRRMRRPVSAIARDNYNMDGITPFVLDVDEDGFIAPSRVHEAADLQIVFLGGSTTESALADQHKRFPYLVGRMLEERLNLKVNSYNSGRSGNNSLHSIDILINKIVPMKPDAVVLMHNFNDLAILVATGSYWNDNASRGPVQNFDDRRRPWFLAAKATKNLLFPNIYTLARNLFRDRGWGGADEFENRGRPASLEAPEMLAMFSANLKTFIAIARANGIEPVLMTQANRLKNPPDSDLREFIELVARDWKLDYRTLKKLSDGFNRTIRRVAEEEGVGLIDLAASLPQSRAYMYDWIHLNNQGSERAAGLITQGLVDLFE